MKRKIIGLEGVPCVGKTTFINKIQSSEKDWYCVPEPDIEIISSDTKESAREKYSEMGLHKCKDLHDVKSNLILDRSFFSSLAFSYAKYITTGDTEDYNYNKNFMEANKNKIIVPDLLFVLSISPEEALKRRQNSNRVQNHKFWSDLAFLKAFDDYFHSEDFRELMPENRVNYINTEFKDENSTFTDVKGFMDSFIKEPQESRIPMK